jgi:hypothetical protein
VLVLPLTLLWTYCFDKRAFRSRDSVVNIYASITAIITLSVCALVLVKSNYRTNTKWTDRPLNYGERYTLHLYFNCLCRRQRLADGWECFCSPSLRNLSRIYAGLGLPTRGREVVGGLFIGRSSIIYFFLRSENLLSLFFFWYIYYINFQLPSQELFFSCLN